MSDERTTDDLWMSDKPDAAAQPDLFLIDIDGYEGPLDLLLALARTQKVDLAQISVLQLAEQYIAYIERMRDLRLEVAADYLVMAAWLVFLKSKLLLPEEPGEEEPTGDELAAALAFRLKRLEAMRKAAKRLMNRHRLGQDMFARGDPEPVAITRKSTWKVTYNDLLSAYATHQQRAMVTTVSVAKRAVWSLKDAQEILYRLVGDIAHWAPLDELIKQFVTEPGERKSALASSFSATLELAKEGTIELQQSENFSPLYVRQRQNDKDQDDG